MWNQFHPAAFQLSNLAGPILYRLGYMMLHPVIVQGVSPYNWERGPTSSTFASGYISGAHPPHVQSPACLSPD